MKKISLFIIIIFSLSGCQREVTNSQFEKNETTQETTEEEFTVVTDEIDNKIVDWQEFIVEIPANSEANEVCVENNVIYYGISYINFLYGGNTEPTGEALSDYCTELRAYDITSGEYQLLYSSAKTENIISNIQCYENQLFWQENSVLDMYDETKSYQLDMNSGEVKEIAAEEIIYVERDDSEVIEVWQEDNEREYLYLKDLRSEQQFILKVNTIYSYAVVKDCIIISGYNMRAYRMGDNCMNAVAEGTQYNIELSVNRDDVVYSSKMALDNSGISVIMITVK